MSQFKCEVQKRLERIEAGQATIINLLQIAAIRENRMRVDLTDVLAAVEEQKTVDESIEKLVDGFAAQLEALAAQPTVDPADVAALATSIRANNAGIQDKVKANTPAAPAAQTA